MKTEKIAAVSALALCSLMLSSCVFYVADEGYTGNASSANSISANYSTVSSQTASTTSLTAAAPPVNVVSVQTVNYITLVPDTEKYYFYDGRNAQMAVWIFKADGSVVKQGKPINGLVKVFYEPGITAAEIYYKNSLRSGSFMEYYRNGRIKVHGNYNSGKRNGSWKMFLPEGGMEEETYYRKDKVEVYYQSKNQPNYAREKHWSYIESEDGPEYARPQGNDRNPNDNRGNGNNNQYQGNDANGQNRQNNDEHAEVRPTPVPPTPVPPTPVPPTPVAVQA